MVVLLFVVIVVIFLFQLGQIIYLLKLYRNKSHEVELKEQDRTKAYGMIIDNANTKAQEILEQATRKSEEILSKTTHLEQNVEKEMNSIYSSIMKTQKASLQEAMNALLTGYKDMFTSTKDEFLKQTNKTVADMEHFSEEEFELFKKMTESKTAEVEKYVKQKIEAEFELAHQEIEKFKQAEITQIQKQVRENVMHITSDILHLSIPRDQHEKLIMNALEKAQKDGLLAA